MGNLEKENKRIVRRTKIQEAILKTLLSGGRLGSEDLIKSTISYLLKIEPAASPSRIKDVIKTTSSRLKLRGLLKFENGHYSVTQEGGRILEKWRRSDFKLPQPMRWDKKWRIIIFDIPEKKKVVRNEIRQIFINAGLKRLQDSVWVYPYDCEDIIGLLKVDYGIGSNLLYIIADQIENDKYLRIDFGLID
ncbi:MAG: hypothetical protein AAB758_02815 [Patescibacteria group bacterium]